jgi:hypothetical protein
VIPDGFSDDALRAADRIILIDPQRPGWYCPLHVRLVFSHATTLEIPVDSTDAKAIQQWQARVAELFRDDA